MNEITKTANIVRDFLKTMKEFPQAKWEDCLSDGQINSKVWLIEELEKLNLNLQKIFLFGGWYGTLVRFMFNSKLKFDNIRSFDIDKSCHEIAETLNRPFVTEGWVFKATTFDIFDIKYPLEYDTLRRDGSLVTLKEAPNTIINTSCEHIYPFWYDKVPEKTLMILQTNNFHEIEEHIDCVDSLETFQLKYSMKEILFKGEKELQKYNRYMLIGYK